MIKNDNGTKKKLLALLILLLLPSLSNALDTESPLFHDSAKYITNKESPFSYTTYLYSNVTDNASLQSIWLATNETGSWKNLTTSTSLFNVTDSVTGQVGGGDTMLTYLDSSSEYIGLDFNSGDKIFSMYDNGTIKENKTYYNISDLTYSTMAMTDNTTHIVVMDGPTIRWLDINKGGFSNPVSVVKTLDFNSTVLPNCNNTVGGNDVRMSGNVGGIAYNKNKGTYYVMYEGTGGIANSYPMAEFYPNGTCVQQWLIPDGNGKSDIDYDWSENAFYSIKGSITIATWRPQNGESNGNPFSCCTASSLDNYELLLNSFPAIDTTDTKAGIMFANGYLWNSEVIGSNSTLYISRPPRKWAEEINETAIQSFNISWANHSLTNGFTHFKVWANDTSGNINLTNIGAFDDTPPVISDASASVSTSSGGSVEILEVEGLVTVSMDVSDADTKVDSATIEIKRPDLIKENVSLIHVSGTVWQGQYIVASIAGIYTFNRLYANDTARNLRSNTSTVAFEVHSTGGETGGGGSPSSTIETKECPVGKVKEKELPNGTLICKPAPIPLANAEKFLFQKVFANFTIASLLLFGSIIYLAFKTRAVKIPKLGLTGSFIKWLFIITIIVVLAVTALALSDINTFSPTFNAALDTVRENFRDILKEVLK